jgi:poly(3-hydroxybutyrate) depolymerase
MYIYVPDKLAAKPPILVVPHACYGKAQDAYMGNKYATLANTYSYIVIYPDSPNTSDKFWDVSSAQSAVAQQRRRRPGHRVDSEVRVVEVQRGRGSRLRH